MDDARDPVRRPASREIPTNLLLRCVDERDTAAWEAFVDRYGTLLRASVRRGFLKAGTPFTDDDIQEMVQEVYCRLLEGGRRRLRSFRGKTEGAAVLFLERLAVRLVLDRQRRAATERRLMSAQRTAALAGGAVPTQERCPEQALVLRERRRAFLDRCRGLARGATGRRNLRILLSTLLEGRTSRELAAELTLSPSAIDTIVHRTRRRLADKGLHLPTRYEMAAEWT